MKISGRCFAHQLISENTYSTAYKNSNSLIVVLKLEMFISVNCKIEQNHEERKKKKFKMKNCFFFFFFWRVHRT